MRIFLGVVVACVLGVGALAAELTPAVTPAELDLPRCVAVVGGKPLPPPPVETLEALLGLRPGADKLPAWSTGPTPERDRYFRVAFTRAVPLGTICTTYAGGRSAETLFQLGAGTAVSYLKPDAPAPGDVTNDDLWVPLPPGEVKTLPPGVTTRALRFADRRVQLPWANLEWGMEASSFGATLLFTERYYHALALGSSKTARTGREGTLTWTGFWTTPAPLAGVAFLTPTVAPARLATLLPEATEHPTLAPAAQWTKAREFPGGHGPCCWRLEAPMQTRALRLLAPPGTLATPLPLAALGKTAEPPTLQLPPPPYAFTYGMPLDGFIAINVADKPSGKHVRRLLAEVARLQGPVTEYWDLKDDSGNYVAPGNYTWTAVARPPLKLTYEGTVNNAGQPPWYAPVKGGGGWMSDHCAPVAACALGEHVFLGTYGSEYGQATIAVDLQGNKVWAAGNVSGERLATDGRYLYLISASGVQRVDPQHNFARRPILGLSYSREVPGPGTSYGNFEADSGSVAIGGGKLFISYATPGIPWLQSAFTDDQVELAKCLPMPRARPKGFDERNYDERQKFFAAFLTGATPSSQAAVWGDAPTSGALQGTLTVVFKQPVPVGSVLLPDGASKVYALRAGAKLPGGMPEGDNDPDLLGGGDDWGDDEEAFDEASWIPLENAGKPGRPTIALAPVGLLTQALRFKAPRLIYCTVFNRRYADLAPAAERVCDVGQFADDGSWKATRAAADPITADNPARMALVWKEPVTLRGVTLVNPTYYGVMAVDYWTGPKDGDPRAALDDDRRWRQAGVIQPCEHYLNAPQTPTAANVDFGDLVLTRAVRVRAILPAGARGFGNPVITGPHNASLGAIVAYRHLGQDPPLLAPLNDRLTVVQLPAADDEQGQAKILQHLPMKRPTGLAVWQHKLYVATAGMVLEWPLDKLAAEPRVAVEPGKLEQPRGMAFDADGLLYVVDAGPKVVKVFDANAYKLVRTIGTPGGPQLGPYDPTRFDNPSGITIDQAGKVWVTDESYQPKRITRWTRDGKLEQAFFGPTTYGGGGVMDPGDHTVINYCGMKFRLDWQTRQWKLEARLYRPGLGKSLRTPFPDWPVYYQGKRYLVGAEPVSLFSDPASVAVICMERNGEAVPLAAAGNLGAWAEVSQYPELRAAFGKLNRARYGFVWSDRNGDGLPQAVEVATTDKYAMKYPTHVGEDLSFVFRGEPGARLRPAEVRPDGVPVYDLAALEIVPELTNSAWTAADGRAFVLGNKLLAADGKTVAWRYPDNYLSVQTSNANPWGFANRPPGVLIGELRIMGHFTAGKEELFVTNGNHGDWYAFTRDGLLAAAIFGGPAGYGRRWWSMPECEPGKTDLSDLRLTVENFYGSICKAEDGKVYAVAGKNHNSLVRVDGLESLQRLNGTLAVSAEQIRQAQAWAVQRAALERARVEPKVGSLPYTDTPPAVDGSLDDWPESVFLTIHEVRNEQGKVLQAWQGALAYDADKLYLAGRASDEGPLTNSADDLKQLFQHGDALEFTLGLDAKADPNRPQPVAGDLRLLLTRVKGEPVVMLYRYVVPGTPAAQQTVFTSPVGQATIDRVERLTDVEISITYAEDKHAWVVEAAIPWQALGGVAPRIGDTLRGDAGVLQSDQDGVATVRRRYWANKSQVVLGDLPSEARVAPALWGDLRCLEADGDLRFGGPEAGLELGP